MKLIIIVIALVIALVVAYLASSFINDRRAEPEVQVLSSAPVAVVPKVERVNIYVAQRDIPIGTVLGANDYDIKPREQRLLPPGVMTYGGTDTPKIDGMIVRTSISKDSPILGSQLRNPNDPTYIAGQLGAGMRAITVPVNMTSSIAGFIAPGDKVDVLFTFELIKSAIQGADISGTKGSGDSHNIAFTEILLPNVRVLAVDKRVSDEPPNPQSKEQSPPPAVPSSVTLEVNQRDAQKVKLAQKMGDLTMVLRSVKDKDSYDLVRPTAEQDLTRILPPAYFPVLFDSDAAYDFGVVDLYGSTLSEAGHRNGGVITVDPKTGKMSKRGDAGLPESSKSMDSGAKENPQMSVNVYRGVQLEKVEVNKP